MSADPRPDIPVGNLEPGTLARFLVNDFTTAWNAMAQASPDPRIGGNFMFARQAFAYLELACRTASTDHTNWYLKRFGERLSERDPRYFSQLPGQSRRRPATTFDCQRLRVMSQTGNCSPRSSTQLSRADPGIGRLWITYTTPPD
jgi:hypothetical protein